MPPPRFSCRCLVFLLLVAAGAGFLARPAEAAKRPFADIVDSAARRHGVDPDLVHAVIAVESGYRASAQSSAGAQGLMQLMPGTQRDLGVSDAFDPRQNVDAGVAYLRRLTDKFGTTALALAAYNAGPGAVRRYNGIPPYEETHAYVRAVLDRGRPTADAQTTEEHDPSGDRAHAMSEADLAGSAPVDRQLLDDHLAVYGAAGLELQALDEAVDLDDRAWVAAPPDQVNLRGAQVGALRQGVADKRPTQVDGDGSTHAAADTARLVLHHGADRLTVDTELCRDGPGLSVLAAMQAPDPGALRGIARRPSSFDGRRVPTSGSDQCAPVGSSPTADDRGVDPPQSGPATCASADSPRRPARGTFDRSGVSRFRDAHPHISHRRRRAPGRTRPLEQLAHLVAGRPRDPAASTWLPACCDQAPERHDAWGAACEQRSYLTGAFGDRSSSTSVSKRSKSFTSA